MKNIKRGVVPWFAGYCPVKPLMEFFDTSSVMLAAGAVFDVATMTVKTEFPDTDEWLENME